MLPRPTDTNRRGCARAEADKGTSHARAGLCAPDLLVEFLPPSGLGSPLTILSFRAKSSILFALNRHGSNNFQSSLPRDRSCRVSLFFRRTRQRVRLHRDDDFVWNCCDHASTNSISAEYPRRHNRLISILAGRTFFLEIILAVPASVCSSGLFRRVSPSVRFDSANSDCIRPAVFRCAFVL